ncbi:GUN4 domain protein [Nostoc linckia NIES-25]|nr:GUN4 domain protein [Nostoc linckia NIES-25]
MTNNQNQPREFDAVLGGEAPPPIQGAVLGGIEGVKRRLSSSNIEARIAALSEALNHGDTGLGLVIEALEDKFRKVRLAAFNCLQDREEAQVKLALHDYKFWSSFEKLNGLPNGYVSTFANRKVIEFEPTTNITETVDIAYALRDTYILYSNKTEITITDKLQLLQQSPLVNQIEALVFGVCFDREATDFSSRHVVESLAALQDKLINLKAVFIGDIEDYECMISSIPQSNVSPILQAYPHLEVLKIRGNSGDYWNEPAAAVLAFNSPLKHEKLKALIIESGGLRHQVINQICELELPALEYLELWLGRDEYGGTSSIDDLMPIISGVFPKLKYLGLRNSEYSDDIAFAIVDSPILENLVELDFSMGTLGDEGAEALLNCPAIQQLDTLNVSDNCLTHTMLKRLKQVDIEIISDGQQKGTQYRYCTVAE